MTLKTSIVAKGALLVLAAALLGIGMARAQVHPPAPTMGACPSTVPPSLPATWKAVAFLMPSHLKNVEAPFSDLATATIAYSWPTKQMWISIYALNGATVFYYFAGDDIWVRETPTGQWYGPYQNSSWAIPGPSWLADKQASCRGTQAVLGVASTWWRIPSKACQGVETDACLQSKAGTTNIGSWLWFRQDTGHPWRFMFTNLADFPVFGTFSAMLTFQSFAPVTTGDLPPVPDLGGAEARPGIDVTDVFRHLQQGTQAATVEARAAVIAQAQALIPGLQPLPNSCQPYGFPTWPNTLYLSGITTPTTALDAYPTEVYYDWPGRGAYAGQLTRFRQQPGGEALQCMEDNVLTDASTYVVQRNANGSIRPGTCSTLQGVGLPYYYWPARDTCGCRGVITDANPVLSPDGDTTIFTCPSGHDSFFWHWFYGRTKDGRFNVPRVFMETPQPCDVSLALIDYFAVQQNTSIDPNMVDVPQVCRTPAKLSPPRPPHAAGSPCNACHTGTMQQ